MDDRNEGATMIFALWEKYWSWLFGWAIIGEQMEAVSPLPVSF